MQVHIGDILSVMNDDLVDGKTTAAPPRQLDGIVQMLNHMIGRDNFTTDLSRAYLVCAPFLKRDFPQFEGLVCREMSMEGRQSWLQEQRDTFGKYHDVNAIPEHELRHGWDSIEEARTLASDKLVQHYLDDNAR